MNAYQAVILKHCGTTDSLWSVTNFAHSLPQNYLTLQTPKAQLT